MNINEYRNRFYNLLESKLGNVKPLICENELDEDRIDLSQTYLSPEKMKGLKDTNKSNHDPPHQIYQSPHDGSGSPGCSTRLRRSTTLVLMSCPLHQ